jgi:hypothetical protein
VQGKSRKDRQNPRSQGAYHLKVGKQDSVWPGLQEEYFRNTEGCPNSEWGERLRKAGTLNNWRSKDGEKSW